MQIPPRDPIDREAPVRVVQSRDKSRRSRLTGNEYLTFVLRILCKRDNSLYPDGHELHPESVFHFHYNPIRRRGGRSFS